MLVSGMLAVYLEDGKCSVRDVAKPVRLPGFALVQVLYAGICNTDLELQRGYRGFAGIPGHEFVGRVVEADSSALVGQRVVGEINLGCHGCSWCDRDLARHCPTRTVLGIVRHPGAFAEFLTLPERNLRIVPPSISDQHAVFTEPLAAACQILDQVTIPPHETVAVLGDGKLGLLIAMALLANGIPVHHFGRHADKLRISAAAGAGSFLDAGSSKYNYVVESTGSAAGLAQAVRMTDPRGTIILKSTLHGMVPVDTVPVIVDEMTLIGSRCGRFEPALHLLESGKVRMDGMISEIMPLSEAERAFARAAEKGVLKVLLQAESHCGLVA